MLKGVRALSDVPWVGYRVGIFWRKSTPFHIRGKMKDISDLNNEEKEKIIKELSDVPILLRKEYLMRFLMTQEEKYKLDEETVRILNFYINSDMLDGKLKEILKKFLEEK